jgi:energy-coupling factor transporter transmembrane protein EcfT
VAVDFFKPGDSFLHRFDPRAKLPLLAVLVACFFLPLPLVVSAIYAAGLAAFWLLPSAHGAQKPLHPPGLF